MLFVLLLFAIPTPTTVKPRSVELLEWSAPDLSITPGNLNREVTQDNLPNTICNPKYVKGLRGANRSTKDEVLKRYLTKYKFWPMCKPLGGEECQFDYLIPLELGGSANIDNIWPQFYCKSDGNQNYYCYGAREKDILESFLQHQVCIGKLKLIEAQIMLANDWVSVYLQLRKYH